MSGRVFRVGTRRSALATRQTEIVVDMLRRACPDAAIEIVTLSTEGDERPEVSLRALGGTGAFVKRLERALVAGEIDLAVHSLKDVPTELESGLTLAGIPPRADPRDALVLPAGAAPASGSTVALPELKPGARVGTGSARRGAQLRALRNDLQVIDIRGNVDTRLRKLDEGQFDALVLASAGLERLGRSDRLTRLLDYDEVVPMVGQGALALEARADDPEACRLAASIDDPATRTCVEAERAFLAALGGGCTLPLGALAVAEGDDVFLRAALAHEDGGQIVRETGRAAHGQANDLAVAMARRMLARIEGTGRALAGCRVLVTRGGEGGAHLSAALAEAGAEVTSLPTTTIESAPDPGALDAAVREIDRYDWIAFTSANAVQALLARLGELGGAAASIRGRIAAIGPATAAALATLGRPPDFVATRSTNDGLGAELPIQRGERVLLPRSDRADRRLTASLRRRGAIVREVVAYRTAPRTEPAPDLRARLRRGEIDAVVLASPSALEGLLNVAGRDPALYVGVRFVAIGPTTVLALRRSRLTAAAVARLPTPAALLEALSSCWRARVLS